MGLNNGGAAKDRTALTNRGRGSRGGALEASPREPRATSSARGVTVAPFFSAKSRLLAGNFRQVVCLARFLPQGAVQAMRSSFCKGEYVNLADLFNFARKGEGYVPFCVTKAEVGLTIVHTVIWVYACEGRYYKRQVM